MYLSLLEIDVTGATGRGWISNPYRIHQRLLMALPDGEGGRLLFRLEEDRQPPRLLVQTALQVDWERCFGDLRVLAATPRQKRVEPVLRAGQRLRFFLRANPTARRILSPPPEDQPVPSGKRLGLLREEDQRAWLERKAEAGGFVPLAFEVRPGGFVTCRRGGEIPTQTYFRVDFEGVLRVTDPRRLEQALASGIGSGKAFGFGLLSLAPL